MRNTKTEMKNTLGGINSRLNDTEEQISELEDRVVEITAAEQKKEKRIKRNEDSLKDFWETASTLIFALQRSQKEKREKREKRIHLKT